MNSDIQEKARALKTSLGNPPWLEGIGISEMGGEPAIFVSDLLGRGRLRIRNETRPLLSRGGFFDGLF